MPAEQRKRESIVAILSLSGVLLPAEVRQVLRSAVRLAGRAARRGRSREFKAAMGVLFKAARIEQRWQNRVTSAGDVQPEKTGCIVQPLKLTRTIADPRRTEPTMPRRRAA